MRSILFLIIFFLPLTPAFYGQEPQTKNTLKLRAGEKGEPAKISAMAWLAGTWRGTGLGGESEEIWSEPANGIMMGMYRMLKGGEPVFYEFLTLSETDATLLIRLKHFHSNFVGWEEKDKTVDFAFIKAEDKRVFFNGLTFERVGKNNANIYLAIRNKDGSVREELFAYKRVK